MTRCKACGADYRKGVLAFLLTPGGLKGAHVCQGCASGGVLLVAPKLASVVKHTVTRSDGVDRAIRQLRTLAKAAVTCAAAASDDGVVYANGRAEGFEGAIEVLKRECGQ